MDNKKPFYDYWPHEFRHCERCGTHVTKLPPFGDRAPEDCPEGRDWKLMRNNRLMEGPLLNPEMEEIIAGLWEEYGSMDEVFFTLEKYGDVALKEIEAFKKIEAVYGPGKVKQAVTYNHDRNWFCNTWVKSFECVNCFYEEGNLSGWEWRQ